MFNTYRTDFKATKAKRPPLCNLKEFSRITGIPYSTLNQRMKNTPTPPEHSLKVKTGKYYELSVLNEWLKEYEQ